MCFLCGRLLPCGRRDLNSGSGDFLPLSGMTGGTCASSAEVAVRASPGLAAVPVE